MRFALSISLTVLAFGVLVSLSYWQWQRLHWKEDLQTQIAERTAQPPLEIRSASDITPIDNYRRATLYGHFGEQKLYWFTQINNPPKNMPAADKVGYHLLQPFIFADGTAIAVDRGFLPARLKNRFMPPPHPNIALDVVLLTPDGRGFFTPADDLANATIYTREIATLRTHWQMPLPPLLADVATQTGALPIARQTLTTLPNRHLGYMLTWGGLAVILVIISFLWHRKAARET